MMKGYEEYNDSDVEWIGLVPSHWNKLKIGRSFKTIGSGTTPKSGSEVYYENGTINWLNTGDLNDSYITTTKKLITDVALEDFSTLKLFPEESVVIALYGATIGKLGHLKIETTTNQACCVLNDSEQVENRYLFYSLLSARQFIISKAYGGGQPNISQDLIKQLYILAPSLKEQTQIARYLDHQTNIIDQLIKQKEKLIERLKEKRQAVINEAVTKGLNPNAKMKDSSIDWLGEVPEDWEIVPLRYLADKVGSGVTPKGGSEVYSETGIIFVRSQNVHFDGLRLSDVARIDDEIHQKMSNSKVCKNDVLLNITGASIGRCCVVNINEEMNVNQHVCIIRPQTNKIISEYLNLVLQSEVGQTQVRMELTGGNRDGLTFEALKGFVLPLPNINSQKELVANIDSEVSKLFILESKISSQIEKLKEYRQSIISEAVTGKIDVREWRTNHN